MMVFFFFYPQISSDLQSESEELIETPFFLSFFFSDTDLKSFKWSHTEAGFKKNNSQDLRET